MSGDQIGEDIGYHDEDQRVERKLLTDVPKSDINRKCVHKKVDQCIGKVYAPVLLTDSLNKDRKAGRSSGIKPTGMDKCIDVYRQKQCRQRDYKDPDDFSQDRSAL